MIDLQNVAVIVSGLSAFFVAFLTFWNTRQRNQIIALDKRQQRAEQETKDRLEARRIEREQDQKEREEARTAAVFYQQQFAEQSALFKVLQTEKNELATELGVIRAKQEATQRDFDESDKARIALGERLKKAETDLVERQKDITGLQSSLNTATTTINDMNTRMAAMRSQHDDDLKALNEIAEKRQNELQQQITALQEVRQTDQQKIADLEDENHRAQDRITELTSMNNSLQNEIAVLRGQIAALKTSPDDDPPPDPGTKAPLPADSATIALIPPVDTSEQEKAA